MANGASHAATDGKSTFAVILLSGERAPAELAGALGSFSDALEHVAEWLDREDASRAGTVKLAIVEDRGGATSTVWSYPPEHVPATGGAGLVDVFGFDPVHWNPQAADEGASRSRRWTDRLMSSPPRPPTFRHESCAEEDEPDPAIAVSPPQRSEPARALSRLNARKALRSTWEDRVLRAFLVLSAVSLWLTVTLTEPRFLVMLFLALGAGTWWHRHRRASASVDSEIDVDDWL